ERLPVLALQGDVVAVDRRARGQHRRGPNDRYPRELGREQQGLHRLDVLIGGADVGVVERVADDLLASQRGHAGRARAVGGVAPGWRHLEQRPDRVVVAQQRGLGSAGRAEQRRTIIGARLGRQLGDLAGRWRRVGARRTEREPQRDPGEREQTAARGFASPGPGSHRAALQRGPGARQAAQHNPQMTGRVAARRGPCHGTAVPVHHALLASLPHQARAIVRVTGEDALRFLQGLLTADVGELTPGRATPAALLTVKGKIISEVWVLAVTEQEPWLVVPAELGDAVITKLDSHIIMDDVELEPLADHQCAIVWRDDGVLTTAELSVPEG